MMQPILCELHLITHDCIILWYARSTLVVYSGNHGSKQADESSDVHLQGSIEFAGELRFQNVLVGVSPAGIILHGEGGGGGGGGGGQLGGLMGI